MGLSRKMKRARRMSSGFIQIRSTDFHFYFSFLDFSGAKEMKNRMIG